jgi:hypothetical protein
MFLYVLDLETSQWIEADELYPHDLALLINNEEKLVYHWVGRQTKESEREIGMKLATELMDRYSAFKLIILDENVTPLQVQKEIDALLGDNVDPEKNRLPRTIAMRIFMYLGFLGLITLIGATISQTLIIGWRAPAFYEVAEETFLQVFFITKIIYIIAAGIFGAQFIVSLITQKIFLIASAFSALIVPLTALLYVSKGVYLFEFTPDSLASGFYQIDRFDVIFHLTWILIFLIGGTVPYVLALINILKLTEVKPKIEVDVDLLRMKTRPTILRDRVSDIQEISKPSR